MVFRLRPRPAICLQSGGWTVHPSMSMKTRASNTETLRSYGGRVQEYIEGTSQIVSDVAKDWIDAALSGLKAKAKILELGSAFGRDAAYILSKGFHVECSDAVEGFVSHLRARGFNARPYNAITDDLTEKYDLILANAVMLHFDRREFAFVLKKMLRSLSDGGRLAFSLKAGEGESWSDAKIGAPRFFCYWRKDELEPFLTDAGFSSWSIEMASTDRSHAEWMFIIAQ
jgi:SAM-dependent methyltransferase